MDSSDNRQLPRDSLFVMANLHIEGIPGEHSIKVRNLSAGGMMGEASVRMARGTKVSVNLRNIGWVPGAVAWVHENRFGVAFEVGIDPRDARAPVTGAQAPKIVAQPWSGRSPQKSSSSI